MHTRYSVKHESSPVRGAMFNINFDRLDEIARDPSSQIPWVGPSGIDLYTVEGIEDDILDLTLARAMVHFSRLCFEVGIMPMATQAEIDEAVNALQIHEDAVLENVKQRRTAASPEAYDAWVEQQLIDRLQTISARAKQRTEEKLKLDVKRLRASLEREQDERDRPTSPSPSVPTMPQTPRRACSSTILRTTTRRSERVNTGVWNLLQGTA